MNNYIDERIIPYERTQTSVRRNIQGKKGRPLTRKARTEGIVTRGLRVIAVIFLFLVSTFSGEDAQKGITAGEFAVKAVKTVMLYGGILLALWGILAVFSNIINMAAALPIWCLILVFAFTVLLAAGALKR